MKRTRIKSIWENMLQRCNNPNRKYYHGKGIKVCKQWAGNFSAFQAWAIKSGYADHLTIDRIDSSKGYSPENCRWATYKQQAWNKSDTRKFVLDGKSLNGLQLERRFGIPAEIIRQRMNLGWSLEKAIGVPYKKRKRVSFQGRTLSMADWSRELGVNYDALKYRIRNWLIEKAFTTPWGKG